MLRKQTFEEFTRDKIRALRSSGFYGGRPPTEREQQRLDDITDLLNEYEDKVRHGLIPYVEEETISDRMARVGRYGR